MLVFPPRRGPNRKGAKSTADSGRARRTLRESATRKWRRKPLESLKTDSEVAPPAPVARRETRPGELCISRVFHVRPPGWLSKRKIAKVAAHPQIGGDSRRAKGRLSGRPFAPPGQSEVRMLQGQILGEYRLVAQKKTAHRTPWTKEDERQLKAYSRARTPLPEIAKKMRRTERALRRKAGILGIGLGHRR